MNGKVLKLIALGTITVGYAATLISDWVSEQQMKNEVREEVAKAMAEKERKES